MRRKWLLLMPAIPLLALVSPCLTSRLWSRVERRIASVVDASLDPQSSLTAIVTLDNGERWEIRVPDVLDETREPGSPTLRKVAAATSLPRSIVPVVVLQPGFDRALHADEPETLFVTLISSDGPLAYCLSSTPWRRSEVSFGRDWWSGATVLAGLLTPVTVIVDCITAPIEVGWIFLTAGGHGRNPIPWCGH